MSDDQFDADGNLIEGPPGEEDPRQWVKDLRAQAKEGKAAIKKLETMERDLVFEKAGIPDDGPGKLFRKAYDGENSEDAIKAAASEYGVIKSDQSPRPDEQAALQRTVAATAGASAPPPESLDEQLAETDKLPEQHRAEAIRQVMVRNQVWADTAAYE